MEHVTLPQQCSKAAVYEGTQVAFSICISFLLFISLNLFVHIKDTTSAAVNNGQIVSNKWILSKIMQHVKKLLVNKYPTEGSPNISDILNTQISQGIQYIPMWMIPCE